MSGPKPGEIVYMVDGNSLVRRLYHAIPLEVSPVGSRHVNALIGWVRTIRRIRQRIGVQWMVPIFDGAGPGWRAAEFHDYKSGRPAQDDELAGQWSMVRGVCAAMNMSPVQVAGVEADDVIAAYTEASVHAGVSVRIVSSDKDLLQLVRDADGVTVHQTSGFGDLSLVGPAEVMAKHGVMPERLVDLLALTGDKSDSIPGVPGIGPKTAIKLLERHGDLGAVLDRWEFNRSEKVRLALRDHAEQARMSRRLVGLRTDLVDVDLASLQPFRASRRALDAFFGELGYPRFEVAVDPVAE